MKGNSKCTSGISLSPLCLVPRRLSLDENVRAKEGGKEIYNRGKITSSTQVKLKKMAEIFTNFTSADNILLDLHNSPDHTPPYPIMLITKSIFVDHAGTGASY